MDSGDTENEFLKIFLDEAEDILSDWEKHCLKLQVHNNQETCDALFRSAHNLKGSARSVGLAEFGRFIHCAEDVITQLRDKKKLPDPEIMSALLQSHSLLSSWRESLLRDSKYVPDIAMKSLSAVLLGIINEGGHAEVIQTAGFGFFDDQPAALEAIPRVEVPTLSEMAPGTKSPEKSVVKKGPSQESIRIPASRIDGLMQLIGELSIQQSTIMHALKNNLMGESLCHKAVHIAGKLTRELQLQTMGLRLTDIGKLFQKLERTARDLAQEQKKDVSIELNGVDVELDKNVIERVSDALVHMVRNAVDHGIEATEERGAKSAQSSLKLNAFQSSSGVTIQIVDDGKGINTERVLAKARSLGIVRADEELSKEKIYDLLFAAGFSTAAKVTEISGRGVGLDVVKRTISDLGGTLEIQSELGKGTTFSISLPLTVSIVDALIIVSNNQSYVVPIQEISEVIDLRSFKKETQHGRSESISLREKSLNIIPIEYYLPLKRSTGAKAKRIDSPEPVMVIEEHNQKIGFSFDNIIGQQPILIRPLADYISDVPGFAGNTVLANGDPALIISPKAFARIYIEKRRYAG